MDIRKLQRAIVDGLEDVKAQNIEVFDTEALSPLFERVILASGTSNRQTKALSASVRDAVREAGFQVLRTEGEDNGEWIIVDCGAAVVHIMQPSIRDYYRLEEIWGEKKVVMKRAAAKKGLVKASEPVDTPPAAKKAPAKKAPAKKVATKKVATKAVAAQVMSAKKPPVKKPAAKKAAAPAKVAPVKVAAKPAAKAATPAAKKPSAAAKKAAPAAKKAAPAKKPARKTAA